MAVTMNIKIFWEVTTVVWQIKDNILQKLDASIFGIQKQATLWKTVNDMGT
jgi:hypothetical protein